MASGPVSAPLIFEELAVKYRFSAALVSTSVTGKVSQNWFSPKREKRHPSGTNSTTVRTTVSAELLKLEPTAWKNTGKVSDVTIGRKLTPTRRKPAVPIAMTYASFVKTRSSCSGNRRKHSVPNTISTRPNTTALDSVFLQRSIFLAA